MFVTGIVCDRCGDMTYFDSNGVFGKVFLTRHFRKIGWSIGKNKVLCPKCRKIK